MRGKWDRATRQAVCDYLRTTGPQARVSDLQRAFTDVPVAELGELLRRHRWICRRKDRPTVRACRWQRPGTVYAMDFTEPPMPLDGTYRYALVVRDLASGQQLLHWPCHDQTAWQVRHAIRQVVAVHGAPAVWKHDNGSAFLDADVQADLAALGVAVLVSPPYTPSYNGACEAGIGGLKAAAQHSAARHDRSEGWTCDDWAWAIDHRNETSRPRGCTAPTPAVAWAARTPFTPAERGSFQARLDRMAAECAAERGIMDWHDTEPEQRRSLLRVAIAQVCLDTGLLEYRRRRVPLPIPRRSAASNR